MIDLRKFNFESDKILSLLDSQSKAMIFERMELLPFKKGKLIFYEKGIPTGAFLIKEGRAKIFKIGHDGKEQIFYIYKQGDLLGYHPLLCSEKYMDACEAIEDSEIYFLAKDDFDTLKEKVPKFNQLLLQNLSHEFGVLVNTIAIHAQKNIRERLALYLLILDQKYFGKEIKILREDLANLIGTARESLSRLLKSFSDDNLIQLNGRDILCLDRPNLFRVANSQIILVR